MNTMTTINTTGDMHDYLRMKAGAFIRAHADAHLDRQQLIKRTMDHLKKHSIDSDFTLERATVRALTEHEAKGQTCYIDINESTAYHVAVRDPDTKAVRIFTVGDLMRLVKTPNGLVSMPTPSKRAACAGQYL